MIKILFAILVLLTVTVISRLTARKVGSNNFKQLGFVVLLISTIYFFLLIVATFIGGESTPVRVTTTNHFDKKIKIYAITVYDYPVYDDLSRFVYKGETLKVGDSSTTIIESDGAMEFWTVGLDEFDKIVFFDTTSSHSIDEYNFTIDKGYIADQYKAGLANSDIKIYKKDKLTKDIMITIDVILILVLILEILTSRTKINKLVYNN